MENNLPGNNMVFGKTSLMYEQVSPGDPELKGISEDALNANLDRRPAATKSQRIS